MERGNYERNPAEIRKETPRGNNERTPNYFFFDPNATKYEEEVNNEDTPNISQLCLQLGMVSCYHNT